MKHWSRHRLIGRWFCGFEASWTPGFYSLCAGIVFHSSYKHIRSNIQVWSLSITAKVEW